MTEKLQKVLANAGLASRREIEQWINDRRISVNGKIVSIGTRVAENDIIRVDGHIIKLQKLEVKSHRVIIYNKPEGEVCTRSDPDKRPTVFENLPQLRQGRWITVGRLDINSSGLLIFTTDGELANRLMHPSHALERIYAVRILGKVDKDIITNLQQGVQLEDGLAKFNQIIDQGGEGANHWYHVSLAEGRNREVRRMWESQGVKVSRLIRLRFGPVELPRYLSRGRWIDLEPKQMQQLYQAVGIDYAIRYQEKEKIRKRSNDKAKRLKPRIPR